MQTYRGTASTFLSPVIGSVTRNVVADEGRNLVLVTDDALGEHPGFGGVIHAKPPPAHPPLTRSQPTVWSVEGASNLSDGDVVRMEPNGSVVVLYEIGSVDNSIFLTNRCNANCGFCPQPRASEDCFATGEVSELIGLMKRDTEFMGITGGEPTLARGLLIEALRACRRHLPDARIDLLTNGILLAASDYVRELADVGHAGLVFEIPLYSDVPSEHDRVMGVQGFAPAVRGIFNLVRYRQKVAIRTVIHSGNYKRLPRFSEFICRNLPFAFHVALMGLEVIHSARANAGRFWVDPVEYTAEVEEAVSILHRADINVSLFNHPLCVLPRSLWQFARASISPWKRLYKNFCDGCYVRAECGGVFATSGEWQSRFLRPVGDRCELHQGVVSTHGRLPATSFQIEPRERQGGGG